LARIQVVMTQPIVEIAMIARTKPGPPQDIIHTPIG
jgi:hypothetical protein